MSLLLKNRVSSIILNDLDTAIYSILHAILDDTERLLNAIENAIENVNVSMETWHQQRQIYAKLRDSEDYSFELAFAAFFLDRTNRSGIITGGPISGMEQTGKYLVDCRFNKKTLSSKIRQIADNRDRIKLHHLDAVDLIRDVLLLQPTDRLFTFFAPPYYQQGKICIRMLLMMRIIENCPWTYTRCKVIIGLLLMMTPLKLKTSMVPIMKPCAILSNTWPHRNDGSRNFSFIALLPQLNPSTKLFWENENKGM